MDKLKMHSADKVQENYEKLAALFPEAVTETITGYDEDGKAIVERAVDADVLRQLINSTVVEGREERYQFTWPDKKKAMLEANAPISATLRPVREKSVDFGKTENLYIEGDNLEVLKLLQETYLGKIKMIYIDPPYNTGNDFVYNDDFAQDSGDYVANSGQYDELGNRMVQNTESNGRFHTDWLNMIYPRLKLAKDLLSDDGVIFISIDDNEVDNLVKCCQELFGAENYIATFPWRKRTAKSDVPFGISQDYEWIIACAKSSDFVACVSGTERKYFESPDFPGRPWRIHDLTKQTSASERPNSFFTMVNPKNGEEFPANPNRTWAITQETFEKYLAQERIVFPGDYDFLKISRPAFRYFKEDDASKSGKYFGTMPMSTKLPDAVGMSLDGTREISDLFQGKVFGFPKSTALLKHLIKSATMLDKDALVLDFFSGSATTAHAVMQLNAEDGGNRKFIMVQLPEKTDEKSEAYKAGYKTICDIGEERIRRAGAKILEEDDVWKNVPLHRADGSKPGDYTPAKIVEAVVSSDGKSLSERVDISKNPDVGFRVLRLDSSNMKDVYYSPNETDVSMFDMLADNIKDDRTPEDLLFQVMLDLGVLLSSKIEETAIAGKRIFSVADGFLIACFDSDVTDETVTAIAKQKPYYAVFRDSGMANDSVATNFDQIFAAYSPSTVRKVL